MTDSTLWQKLTSEDNLYSAWLKVAGNMGAGGVDRVSIEDFQLNLKMSALHPAVATPKMPEPSRREDKLNALFDNKGVNSLPTELGLLRRIKGEEKNLWVIEI